MLTEMTTDPEELNRKLEGETQPEDEEAKITGNPKFQKRYPFNVDVTTADGRRYTGAFVNKILNLQERARAGAMRASMQFGMPVSSIDEETTYLNQRIAHMTFSLVERADWAKNLGTLDDEEVLEALWTEVQGHEATFHGPRDQAATGAGPGKDD